MLEPKGYFLRFSSGEEDVEGDVKGMWKGEGGGGGGGGGGGEGEVHTS